MPEFVDKSQRTWEVTLDAPTCMVIRKECDPDFLKDINPHQPSTFARLAGDPVLLCNIIYLICRKQMIDRGVSQEEFYTGVMGSVIDDATSALKQAIVNFSPKRTREMLEMFQQQDRVEAEMTRKAMARLDSPEVKAQFESKLDSLLTSFLSATDTPDSSESTPADSPPTSSS